MTSGTEDRDTVKGTCGVCGKPAPDSVICDDCFLERVVRPTMKAIKENR
jgi:hypothetical protein